MAITMNTPMLPSELSLHDEFLEFIGQPDILEKEDTRVTISLIPFSIIVCRSCAAFRQYKSNFQLYRVPNKSNEIGHV